MRHHLLLYTVLLFCIISCSRQERVVIKGRVEYPVPGDKVYVEELGSNDIKVIDSSKVRSDGRFKNTLGVKVPGFYQLEFKSGPSLSLILLPGEKISITASMDNFYTTKQIEGSPNSIRLNILHDSLRSTVRALNEIRDTFNILANSEENVNPDKERLTRRFIEIENDYHRYSTIFILEDLTALSNIGALYQEYAPDEYVFRSQRDIQFFKLVSDSLIKYYPDVRYVKTLRDNYQNLFSDYNTRKLFMNKEPVSYDVPDLNLPGPDGEKVSLSSLKGRIVLLTFWSVSQKESIQNTLELKKIYKRYHNSGFEIYQVSVNKALDDWKKVLAFEEIPWISVCDTSFPDSKTRYYYNVNTLPMNYLLDREQKEILAKNILPDLLEKNLPYLINR